MRTDKTCRCGCGGIPRIAKRVDNRYGHVKGEPVPYINGHQQRGRKRSKGPDYIEDPDTGCWEWQKGAGGPGGYGGVWYDGQWHRAPRFYYEQAKGPIPEGFHIDHLCRNPPCVNPDHLEAVTPAENVQRGNLAKITAETVRQIREAPRGYGTTRRLARKLGISEGIVSSVRLGATWRNV